MDIRDILLAKIVMVMLEFSHCSSGSAYFTCERQNHKTASASTSKLQLVFFTASSAIWLVSSIEDLCKVLYTYVTTYTAKHLKSNSSHLTFVRARLSCLARAAASSTTG